MFSLALPRTPPSGEGSHERKIEGAYLEGGGQARAEPIQGHAARQCARDARENGDPPKQDVCRGQMEYLLDGLRRPERKRARHKRVQ